MAQLPDEHAPLIITLDEDSGEKDGSSKVTTSEQLRTGRKRAKKLRQRMAARSKFTTIIMMMILYNIIQMERTGT